MECGEDVGGVWFVELYLRRPAAVGGVVTCGVAWVFSTISDLIGW